MTMMRCARCHTNYAGGDGHVCPRRRASRRPFNPDATAEGRAADARALRKELRFWSEQGWDAASIAIGWFLARGYERELAQQIAEAAARGAR